jgi:hypothetical protein
MNRSLSFDSLRRLGVVLKRLSNHGIAFSCIVR